VGWRHTPHGRLACSMRRRRSWRPSGCACSRTRPCGSVSSPICSPRCLRPGPDRPASASPPPTVGHQAHRRHRTVAGGRRGDGPRRRFGLFSGLLRRLARPARKALSDKGGDAPPMITSRQRIRCRPTFDSDVRVTAPITASRVGLRTHRHSGWHVEVGTVHHIVARPGQVAGRLQPALSAAWAFPRKHQ
jgi:hypothetical protein